MVTVSEPLRPGITVNQTSGYAEELCQFSFLFAIRPTAEGRLSLDGLFWGNCFCCNAWSKETSLKHLEPI